jgi:hypothetical protein
MMPATGHTSAGQLMPLISSRASTRREHPRRDCHHWRMCMCYHSGIIFIVERVVGISPKIQNATDNLAMGVPPPALLGECAHWCRIALIGLGVVTLAFGGSDWATYGWTMVFLALAEPDAGAIVHRGRQPGKATYNRMTRHH